ncbi:hypothetical protein MBLNU459_g2497t2 [Dothideomycetes sp. NU459]
MFGRNKRGQGEQPPGVRGPSADTDRTLTPAAEAPTDAQIKRATKTRLIWALITSFLLVITVVFMILVEVGDTRQSQKVTTRIYFIKLNLTNIIPTTVPESGLINSIAQTLGLHDFYTVGLWGFCEGYNNQGVTGCSKPRTLYWFNPVEIILNELLAGATITLPVEVTNILDLIKIVSHWMFGLFLSGACLAFVMIFLNPLAVYSRWLALFTGIFTFLAALLITVAAVIATVLFVIMKNAFTSVTELNIGAELGVEMFAFMWIADVKRGKKRGSKKAWNTETTGVNDVNFNGEKPAKKGFFGRKK